MRPVDLSSSLFQLHRSGPPMKTGQRYRVEPFDSMGSKGWTITADGKVFIFYGQDRIAAENAALALNLYLSEKESVPPSRTGLVHHVNRLIRGDNAQTS